MRAQRVECKILKNFVIILISCYTNALYRKNYPEFNFRNFLGFFFFLRGENSIFFRDAPVNRKLEAGDFKTIRYNFCVGVQPIRSRLIKI